MRILLLADIHANWPALQAVITEPHDVCLCLGDLVDYGVEPVPCIDWIRTHAQHIVRGNHDHGVAQNVQVQAKAGFKFLTSMTRPLNRQLVSETDLRWLGRLPISKTVTIETTRFLLVHASPRDPLDEYSPPDPEFWSRRLQNIDADVICVGHTHHPYVLEVGDKLVINPGSVGQPRDGDPRASYAIIQDYNIELKRIDYPIEQTVAAIMGTTLEDSVKELLAEAFRKGASPWANGQRAGG